MACLRPPLPFGGCVSELSEEAGLEAALTTSRIRATAAGTGAPTALPSVGVLTRPVVSCTPQPAAPHRQRPRLHAGLAARVAWETGSDLRVGNVFRAQRCVSSSTGADQGEHLDEFGVVPQ
jgi:hypothetical protein